MKTIAMIMLLMLMALLSISSEAQAGVIKTDAAGVVWELKKGDNIWNVCRILCKSVSVKTVQNIAKDNNIKDVRRIQKGKKIRIARRYMNNFLVGQTADVANAPQTDSGQARRDAEEIQMLQGNLDLALAKNSVLETANDDLSKELSSAKDSLAKIADERADNQNLFFAVIGVLVLLPLTAGFFLVRMAGNPNRLKELQKSVNSLNEEHAKYVQELDNDRKEQIKNLEDAYATEVARLQREHLEELQKKGDRSIEFEFDPKLFRNESGQYEFGGEEVGSEKEVQERLKAALMACLYRDISEVRGMQAIYEAIDNNKLKFS